MILHVFESGRHLVAPKLWAGWSTAMHAAVVAGAIGGAYERTVEPPPAPQERVRYVLPALPAPAITFVAAPDARTLGHGPDGERGVARPAPSDLGDTRLEAAEPTPRAGGGSPPPSAGAAASDSGTAPTVRLYLADAVDTPVERDAASDGPRYPETLQALGVEGAVAAEWVVDSAGRADPATFRTTEATHPLFADAVREVLPRMVFRPAVAAGRPVAQLVRQRFQFRIAPPAPAPSPPPA